MTNCLNISWFSGQKETIIRKENRIITEILEINSDIVIVTREWKKIIERIVIIEGINKVKIVLEQEI